MNYYYYFNDEKKRIIVSDETLKLTPHTFMGNQQLWENDSINYFYRHMLPTEKYNIIDVGAQSGLYTLYAKYLPLSTFYSFEPFTPTFNLLNQNIHLNNISNVQTYNIGLSNKKDKMILNTCVDHNGLHTLGTTPLRFNNSKPVEIEVNTIDALFFEKNIPVHFIKIDTEGWEYNILSGAIKTINKYKPMIQIEWCETNMQQCNIKPSQLNDLINEIGYIKQNQISEELFIVPQID